MVDFGGLNMDKWLLVAQENPELFGDSEIGDVWDWWDVDPEIKKGDICLIYQKSPYSRIELLGKAISDPVPESEQKLVNGKIKMGHTCEIKIIYEFENKLRFRDMKNNEVLSSEWKALRQNFQRMWFPIDPISWNTLNDLLSEDEGYSDALKSIKTK